MALMGMEFINRETGVEPSIAEGVVISGVIDCIDEVILEKGVFTGHDVMLLTGSHDYTKFGEERKASTVKGPIHIKEGAWIGTRAIILGGVTVGKHSVIGAGAVISKNVGDYEVWAGNPSRCIKKYNFVTKQWERV